MILARVLNERGNVCTTSAGYLHDLRGVAARFLGVDEPTHNESLFAIERAASRWGESVVLDGSALTIRAYRIGTLHVHVHAQMAWCLNALLAVANPQAIPYEHRRRRNALADEAALTRPLPFAVRYLIASAHRGPGGRRLRLAALFDKDAHAMPQARDVLTLLGGVPGAEPDCFDFAHDMSGLVEHIALVGTVPDAPRA